MKRIFFLAEFLVVFLAASACFARVPASIVEQPESSSLEASQAAAAQDQTVVIPAGTRVPLTLASPIATKSAHPGYAIRAVTAFPITVGTQVVIPSGAYVEGVIDKVTRGGPAGRTLQIRFTRILYANGYSLPVDGGNTQARVLAPRAGSGENSAYSFRNASVVENAIGVRFILAAQQQPPTLPPLPPQPRIGPSIGAVVGVTVGIIAAAIITTAVLVHHNGGGNAVLFDTGWQFEMVLKAPATLSLANIALAPGASSAQ